MRRLLCLIAIAAVGALASCASMQNEIISGFCGADPRDQQRWARIEAPADAETYRTLARSDVGMSQPRGEEYWFALTSGEIKYCLSPLQRASTVPERNGSNCDDRVGWWWIFEQTSSGPVTRGAEERICLT